MNDSLLLIIKYLLKKKNIKNEDQSIDSFYSNGISFPIFVSKIFNFVDIPDIIKNPKSELDRKNNNDITFQFILDANEIIKSKNPSIKTKHDRIQLLQLLLTIQCFPESAGIIIKKLNIIFKKINYQIYNENELYNFKNISLLLNLFTNGLFPITNLLDIIIQYCSETDIPLVINKDSLEVPNHYIFLIQIQIFFDFFSNCSQKKLDSIKNQLHQKKIESKNENKIEKNPKTQIKQNKKSNTLDNLQDFNKAIELWNGSPYTYFCYNGILLLKSDIDTFDNVPERISNFDIIESTKNKTERIYQIFKYDEKMLRWTFCQSEFDKLFNKTKKDPKVQLILFMNSNFLTRKIHDNELGEDISIFSFEYKINDNDEYKKYCFFLNIPHSKIYHKNIRSIFFQIYSFLYIICDINIIQCDISNGKKQALFVRDIIKISDIYFKNSKKSTSKNEYLFRDHSKLFFNIIDYFLFKEINDIINNKEFHFINKLSENDLITLLNKISYDNSYRLSELKEIFLYSHSKFSEISELYLYVFFDIKNEDHPNFIRAIVNKRLNDLLSEPKYKDVKGLIINDLKNESENFFPKFDKNFSSIFEKELLEKAFETNQFDKSPYINELDKYSKINLRRLNKIEDVYNEKKIDTFLKSHITLLQKKFYEIIKSFYDGSINLMYEKLNYLLEEQISKDKEKILGKFKENEKKETLLSFSHVSSSSAKNVVNERQLTNEIQVNINSDDDLDNIIPQDF